MMAPRPLQGLAKLRLEKDHQHQRAVFQHGHEQPVQRGEAQQVAGAHNQQQQKQTLQHGAAPGLAGEHEQLINNHSHDQNVDNIRQAGAVKHVPHQVLDHIP